MILTIFNVEKLRSQAALLTGIVTVILQSQKSSLKTCYKGSKNLVNSGKL